MKKLGLLVLSLIWSVVFQPLVFSAGNTYYVSLSGSDGFSCAQAQDIAQPKRTLAAAVACMSAGDTLYIRGGTWNEQINLVTPTSKTGTSTAWMTFAGYPGDTVILKFTNGVGGYGAIRAWGNRGYFVFKNFKIDGTNMGLNVGWQIRDGNHHFILDNLDIYNQEFMGVLVTTGANNITIQNSKFHDMRSDCVPGHRFHGFYLHDGANITAINNEIYNTPGGGIQLYPGPWTGAKIYKNYIHHTDNCGSSSTSSIVVGSDDNGPTGSIIGSEVVGNIIAFTNRSTTSGTTTGTASGIRVYNNSAVNVVSGTKIRNNTVYKVYNPPGSTNGYCILVAAGAANTDVKNNVMTDCGGGSGGLETYADLGTGTTASNNACTSTEDCPATNKVTIASAAAVLVDPDNGDFRLKQGTNVLRNAGAAVDTRPSTVDGNDVGAYEQGKLASAAVVGGYIEATINTANPGVQPTVDLQGFSVTCVGCTGTPVVSASTVLPAALNVARLTISGISTPGTCTLSYTGGNVTDSDYIGQTGIGLAQTINSAAGVTVSGNCQNTAGGGSPPTAPYLYYKLNTGSGSSAIDETGNARHGTIVGTPQWVTPVVDGYGLYFPNDGGDHSIDIPVGNGWDPTVNSFTFCGSYKLDPGLSNKILAGAGSSGTNRRFYFGTSAGQTWQLGIRANSYQVVGESEFAVNNNINRICMAADAATDTVYLVYNGVKGNTAASKVLVTVPYTLAADLIVNCGPSPLSLCGGVTVDEVKVWDRFLSDAEFVQDFQEFNAPATPLACHSQIGHKFQKVYTKDGAAVNYLTAGATGIVVERGGVVVHAQVDCTVVPGSPLAFRWYYSKDGTNFDNPVPLTLGADGIAMWNDVSSGLNNLATVCCISGALTPNSGPTLVTTNLSPTVTLTTGSSYTIGGVFRFGPSLAGTSIWLKLKQDNGVDLANGYPNGTIRIDFITKSGVLSF